MRSVLLGSVALLLTWIVAGCSSAGSPSVGQTGQDLSGSAGGVPDAAPPPPVCPPGEHACRLEEPNGICAYRCVGLNVLCVAPPDCDPIVCDPPGPPPRPLCHWDFEACEWVCPICDPPAPPRPGCTWDLQTCKWVCPVCDPPPPPPPGCQWDPTHCVWLCL